MPNPGGRNDRVWVLWPAWAFRVIAPEFRRRPFNALQKAILGVLRASRHTAAELGERLGVHPELAAFRGQRAANPGSGRRQVGGHQTRYRSARRGTRGIHEPGARLGLQGPVGTTTCGPSWPRLSNTPVPGRTRATRVVLDLGTTGRPWQQSAWMQFPPEGQQPPPPDAHQILRAARRHRRLERQRQEVSVPIDEDDIETGSVAGLDLNRVASIETGPGGCIPGVLPVHAS